MLLLRFDALKYNLNNRFYRMKKVFVLVSAALLSAGIASAQNFEQATNLAKEGNEAIMSGDFKVAIEKFKAAAAEASACAEDGASELVANCKKGYVQAQNAYAKALYKEGKLEEAIAETVETVKVAADNGEYEIAEQAQGFKTQLQQAYANAKMKAASAATDATAKVAAYKEALAQLEEVIKDLPENGKAYLQKGQILGAIGQKEAAVEAFVKAKELGMEEQADKQLSTIYLKEAAALNKAAKYAEAIEAALKSVEYQSSANAYKIAGVAAGKSQKFAEAAEYLEKYVELAPTAKDAEQMKAAAAAYKAQIKK